MSYFPLRSLVVARHPVQGMVLGAIYRVVAVDERVTPWGTFSAYTLRWYQFPDTEPCIVVANLHMLADQLTPPDWVIVPGFSPADPTKLVAYHLHDPANRFLWRFKTIEELRAKMPDVLRVLGTAAPAEGGAA